MGTSTWMVLFSAEKMYQTLKTVFEHISKHLDVCLFSVSGNVVKHCLSCLIAMCYLSHITILTHIMICYYFFAFFFCFTIDVHVAGFLAKLKIISNRQNPYFYIFLKRVWLITTWSNLQKIMLMKFNQLYCLKMWSNTVFHAWYPCVTYHMLLSLLILFSSY